jgi:hypothetical protein
LVPKGTYRISAITNPAITSHVSSNVHLMGEGREVSILRVAGVPAGNFLFCSGDNWSVEDLTIDMQDYFTDLSFAAIVATGSNWRITNCAIVKIGRVGINAGAGAHGYIEGNLVTKTVASPRTNSAILAWGNSGDHPPPANMHIIDNACVNSAIIFNGKNSIIARNRVTGSRCGTGIGTGVYSDNVSVINNTCSGGRGRDETNCIVNGFELWAPNSVIANNTSYDNDGAGIETGGNNCIVIGNRCWNNAGLIRLSGVVGGSGIVARAHPTWPNAASGSLFIGNSCFDTRPRGAMTQAYGYNEVGKGLKNIKHFENDYNRNRIGPAKFSSAGGQMQISPEMKNKLKALAQDPDMPDIARRALREYLEREE